MGVTNWPIGGSIINVLSTHSQITWEFNAALVGDLTRWVPLTPALSQTSVGTFCEPQILGNPAWVNQDAVLQVIGHSPDGELYQACPLKYFHVEDMSDLFVAGGAASVPGDCTNSTGVAASWNAPPPPLASSTPVSASGSRLGSASASASVSGLAPGPASTTKATTTSTLSGGSTGTVTTSSPASTSTLAHVTAGATSFGMGLGGIVGAAFVAALLGLMM
ncbi:hypothetical protein CONLIGDRAFT_672541 [Coniochaeta ligniaria NRRL 30616]|uniref:Copper acquisition factor BIM1-like domain-containing protein n=1 Tax=Coniochaeta ligniaria NRRL 30616 TaxID=1408157 RepID=A0A1J7IDZ7_9PEZI|nr:hypothetical protein CONLIGDRAFT_672541 [Coniochaeta ligniaria NRRL 30616]